MEGIVCVETMIEFELVKATARPPEDDDALKKRFDRYFEMLGHDTSKYSLEDLMDSLNAAEREDFPHLDRSNIGDWLDRQEEETQDALRQVYPESDDPSSPYYYQNDTEQDSANDKIDQLLQRYPKKVYFSPMDMDDGSPNFKHTGAFQQLPSMDDEAADDQPLIEDSPLLSALHAKEQAKQKAFGEDISGRVDESPQLRYYHPDIRNSLDEFKRWLYNKGD